MYLGFKFWWDSIELEYSIVIVVVWYNTGKESGQWHEWYFLFFYLRLSGGGVATSPGSSKKTGSLPRRDCSPDTPFVCGKASLTVFRTDFAVSSTCSLACVKVFLTDFGSGNASRTLCTASFTWSAAWVTAPLTFLYSGNLS